MVAGLSITILGFVVAPATAQSVSTPYGSQGASSTTVSSASQPAATTQTASSGNQAGSGGSGGLAFTGTDVIGTVVVAFALIGGGIVMVRFSRRRHNAHNA